MVLTNRIHFHSNAYYQQIKSSCKRRRPHRAHQTLLKLAASKRLKATQGKARTK